MKNPQFRHLPSVDQPSPKELREAHRVITHVALYFYQILLREGLASSIWADRSPFNTGLVAERTGLQQVISIEHKQRPEFNFHLNWSATEDELLTKCRLILAAIKEGQQKEHRFHSCCALSVQQICVCTYRQSCPIHGTSCKGTHD